MSESTVDMTRPAGCYIANGNAGFMEHGGAFTKTLDRTGCRGIDYTCQDGELLGHPFYRCVNVPTASKPIPTPSLR